MLLRDVPALARVRRTVWCPVPAALGQCGGARFGGARNMSPTAQQSLSQAVESRRSASAQAPGCWLSIPSCGMRYALECRWCINICRGNTGLWLTIVLRAFFNQILSIEQSSAPEMCVTLVVLTGTFSFIRGRGATLKRYQFSCSLPGLST